MEQKIFIFDFDGTLVDSMPHWSAMVLNILDSCKLLQITTSIPLTSWHK